MKLKQNLPNNLSIYISIHHLVPGLWTSNTEYVKLFQVHTKIGEDKI